MINKKFPIFILVLSVIVILSGVVIAIIVNNSSPNIDSTSNQNQPQNSNSQNGNNINMNQGLSLARVEVIKNEKGNYDLIIYNNGIDPGAFQLRFQSSNQFQSFIPNEVYDATLLNQFDQDGKIYIDIGKLVNLNTKNDKTNTKGGFIIGEFILRPGVTTGSFKIDNAQDQSMIYNNTQGSIYFDQYEITVP